LFAVLRNFQIIFALIEMDLVFITSRNRMMSRYVQSVSGQTILWR